MLLKNFLRLSNAVCQSKLSSAAGSRAAEIRLKGFKEDSAKRLLTVEWSDGFKGRYPYVWLRDNAPAEHTYNITDTNRARTFLMDQLDLAVKPESVSLMNDSSKIRIEWEEGREALYSSNWLRQREMSHVRSKRYQYHRIIKRESWSPQDDLQTGDYQRMMSDSEYMVDALERFLKYGFLHIVNVPLSADQLNRLIEAMGYVSTTHYGGVFSVKPLADASNLAYTAKALGLHTDLPQMSTPPQIQVLHCVKQSKVGGENQFCDGFRVAEALETEEPALYHLLESVDIEYIDWTVEDVKFQMAHRYPVINLDERGDLDQIMFNNQIRSWYFDVSPEGIPDVYRALKTFYEYCYQPRHLLNIKLNDGEMAMFANNRILHGRSQTGNDRHYEGCYLAFDAVKSKIRVSREEHGTLGHATYSLS